MGREDEFQRNAEEAERRAREARTEDERLEYEKIARGWRDLIIVQNRRMEPR